MSFEKASKGLKALREKEPDYANLKIGKRLMLWGDEKKRSLILVEFDREQAIASFDRGQAVIPIWLDRIYKRLKQNLIN